jgi:hypothetical protein
MDLETTIRELMKCAHVAIALVPALGVIPDDSLPADLTPLDEKAPAAKAPGSVTDARGNS